MRRSIGWIIVVAAAMGFAGARTAAASVILNEILADPPSGLAGDANGDGARSGAEDEFIELMNTGAAAADITGWSLADGFKTRHVFSSGTVLAPGGFLAVFGGGAPALPGIQWQTASTGSLGLNNGGDVITLFDAYSVLIDQAGYGADGGKDQSITLFPDGSSDAGFLLHTEVEEARGALFSPGSGLNPPVPTVPEPPVFLQFLLGWTLLLFKPRR